MLTKIYSGGIVMNKSEMISAIAEKTGFSKKAADVAVGAFFSTLAEAMKNGDKVSIIGFGTFEVKDRAAREGINPKTKERIHIAATKVPAFKAGKTLKDSLKL